MNVLSRNNVKVLGKGTRPMVFAHGFASDQSIWRYITPAFEDAFRIILFDYVGCGQSDRKAYSQDRYATLDGYAADLLDVCDALQLQDVVLVAHSISGMIGIIAAKQRQRLFKSMIMLGASACYMNEPGYQGGFEREDLEGLVASIGAGKDWAGQFAQAAMGGPDYPELTGELVQLFCSMEPGMAQQFAKATLLHDHRPGLEDYQVDTLVLQSGRDAIVPVNASEYIRRYMQNGTMVELDTVGHFPQLNAPNKTVKAMWDYLYDSWGEETVGSLTNNSA